MWTRQSINPRAYEGRIHQSNCSLVHEVDHKAKSSVEEAWTKRQPLKAKFGFPLGINRHDNDEGLYHPQQTSPEAIELHNQSHYGTTLARWRGKARTQAGAGTTGPIT